MYFILRLALALLIFLATIAIYLRNRTPVALDLYVHSIEGSLAGLLALALGTGLVLGYLITLPHQWHLGREARRLRRRMARVQSDLDGLKANVGQEQARHAGTEVATTSGSHAT